MTSNKMPFDLTILIPTYNEEDIIGHALAEIAKALGDQFCRSTEVIIVDDGKDGLPQVVAKLKSSLPFGDLYVKRHTPGVGKGRSLAWGFENAKGAIVGFLDVDLSTPPYYILQAYETIKSNKADIFIGSRRHADAEIQREQFFLKDILGDILGVIARSIIFFGMRKYKDTQCGFKFYKNADAKVLYRDLVAPDGLNDLEVLIKANMLDYQVQEVGVKWTDLRESKRSLKRILAGEVVAMLRILFKYKLCAPLQRKNLKASL